ncbi:hypothetical protein SteCoe_19328 [Stentor coeruleus]|uniref:Magnesium transporter n=1 Tax=Stentor coeruleus TaxID=5963 RepID=A0A1R2BUE0_9CILI|nr:hypothetical protein SteCoe_19328 [Stentor coeruleus]
MKIKTTNFIEASDTAAKHNKNQDPYAMIFIGLEDEQIWEIRRLYNLHPLLDSECESSYFNNKDSMLDFEDCLFIIINDADYNNDDPEIPISLKIIKRENFLLIFSEDDLYCIDKVFQENSNGNLNDSSPQKIKTLFNSEEKDSTIPEFWFEITEANGCSPTEIIIVRLYESLYCRLEAFILDADLEARECMDRCRIIGPDDRVDFIIRLSSNKKRLIYLFDLVDPKIKILKKLIGSGNVSEGLKHYLRSLLSKTYVFQQRLRMSQSMLNTAEHIYSVQVDQALNDYSDKLNEISRYFSAFSAIFLPMNLIAGYFGMNVIVPGQMYENLNTFIIICGICIGIFILLTIYYKIKRWI